MRLLHSHLRLLLHRLLRSRAAKRLSSQIHPRLRLRSFGLSIALSGWEMSRETCLGNTELLNVSCDSSMGTNGDIMTPKR